MRLCFTCGEVLPDSKFRKIKFISGNYDLDKDCKSCRSAKDKLKYFINRVIKNSK